MTHFIESETLRDLIKTGQKALRGDSNDAEHDALYEIVQTLETLQPQSKKKSKPPEPEGP